MNSSEILLVISVLSEISPLRLTTGLYEVSRGQTDWQVYAILAVKCWAWYMELPYVFDMLISFVLGVLVYLSILYAI